MDEDEYAKAYKEGWEAANNNRAEEDVKLAPADTDWVAREEAVRDQALRVSALEAVASRIPSDPSTALDQCEKVFQWLKNGPQDVQPS